MKKKKWKIVLIILAILIIAGVLVVRHFLYDGISSEEKKEIQGQIDQLTEQVLTQIESEKTGTDGEGDSQDGVDGTTGGSIENGESSKLEVSDGWSPEAKKVLSSYYNGMVTLQAEGNGIVDGLLSSAKADYQAIKDAGGGKDQLASLASSYSSRANAMESGMNSSVSSLLEKMKADLAACGVPESEIKAQVSAFQAEYEAQKKARKESLMAQVEGLL